MQENLSADLLKSVEDSKVYFSTRGKLFCHKQDCRKYIAPEKVDKDTGVGFCDSCWGGTCALCHRYPHIGTCRKDFTEKAMENVLIYKGWKRCQQCGGIVEKLTGCNHMTCNCGEEFCYVCGEHWRHCDCPQFGDHKSKDHRKGNAWFQMPQVPQCYGKEFLVNTCLPQTFYCARCEHRCGKSEESSYQCQDCGRHLCRSCTVYCVDKGRYHNPDWNAEPAEPAETLVTNRDPESQHLEAYDAAATTEAN
ncbi:hypothetical protein Daus18300_004546 [Diaporthe australafricana]|uniref:RBR-type E3 ubiquitin transferase n=1 Tax=Diaporthe australafricana TaxID=127596 RepID=A0ABR3X8A9_9PEZI